MFVNRPLPRDVFVAVRWTRVMELLLAIASRYRLRRFAFLCDIEVDFERLGEMLDEDDRLQPTAPSLSSSSQQPHTMPMPQGLSDQALPPTRGVWV